MSRVAMIEGKGSDEQTAQLFEAVAAMLGRVPNSYRVLAHSPLVAKMLLPFNAVMQREGAGSVLSAKLKEWWSSRPARSTPAPTD